MSHSGSPPAFEWPNLVGQDSVTDTEATLQDSRFLTCFMDPESKGLEHWSCLLHCSKHFSVLSLSVDGLNVPSWSAISVSSFFLGSWCLNVFKEQNLEAIRARGLPGK